LVLAPSLGAELSRYFGASGELLFVGVSKSAVVSLCRHMRAAPWRRSIARLTIERFDEKRAALAAKRRAIAEEKPAHNLAVGRPRFSSKVAP
jgi:hypothetical protein